MSRLETGQRAATPADVAAFCGLCRVARPERARLVELAADAFVTTWVQPLEGQPPDALHTLLYEESIARRIDIYDPLVIPPLAQTEDYTRALIDHTGTDAAANELLAARAARQQALATAGRAWLTLFIPEPVLTSPIGGDRVMHAQLLHLVMLGGQSTPYTIRIVPGWPRLPAFELITLKGFNPLVFVETPTNALFLEDPLDMRRYQDMLGRISVEALDGDTSWGQFVRLAQTYDRPTKAG